MQNETRPYSAAKTFFFSVTKFSLHIFLTPLRHHFLGNLRSVLALRVAPSRDPSRRDPRESAESKVVDSLKNLQCSRMYVVELNPRGTERVPNTKEKRGDKAGRRATR